MKTIILDQAKFEKAKDGTMNIWLTIDDDYAKSIEMGEIVIFMNDETSEHIYARIYGYHVHRTFAEIISKVDKTALGYGKNEKLDPSDLYEIYSADLEKRCGAKGFKFEILPNFKTVAEMNDQELKDYIKSITKQFNKQINKQFGAMSDNGERIKGLTKFMEIYPKLFSDNLDFINRDMLKYFIRQDIKTMQKFLATIEKCERENHLPMHPDGKPHP